MMKIHVELDKDAEIIGGSFPFISKSFRDMEVIPASCTFRWKPGALIKSGNTMFKIKHIDNISVSVCLKGEFELQRDDEK